MKTVYVVDISDLDEFILMVKEDIEKYKGSFINIIGFEEISISDLINLEI